MAEIHNLGNKIEYSPVIVVLFVYTIISICIDFDIGKTFEFDHNCDCLVAYFHHNIFIISFVDKKKKKHTLSSFLLSKAY